MNTSTSAVLPADWNTVTQHYSYAEFRHMLDALHAEGKVTGAVQDEHLLEYSKLNDVRMNRIDKHGTLSPALLHLLHALKKPMTLLVITEGWCGDSAQILPYIHKIAEAQPLIQLSIVLRDENPEWMDRYLTNGSRSIPIAVVFDSEGNYLTHWGPRPKAIAETILQWKKEEIPMEKIKEQLHLWYARDKGTAFCEEWCQLIQKIA
jgi:hypothetical protein